MPDEDEFNPPDLDAIRSEKNVLTPSGNKGEVSAIIAKQHDRVMDMPGVVMIGETVDIRGEPAIVIGVRKKKHLKKLPESLEGLPVVGQVIGKVKAQ